MISIKEYDQYIFGFMEIPSYTQLEEVGDIILRRREHADEVLFTQSILELDTQRK